MNKKNRNLREWIFFVSKRFSKFEKESRFAVLSVLPKIGIAVGVLSLIVIISVMNGFQLESINSILETSSFHLQARPIHEQALASDNNQNFDVLIDEIQTVTQRFKEESQVLVVTPFLESQGLLVGNSGRQSPVRIRALSPQAYSEDQGFQKNLRIYSGRFNLEEENAIILGSGLAQTLNVRVGDKVHILALAGSADVDLFSNERVYVVTALFYTGYGEINAFNAFISFDEGVKLFDSSTLSYGIKLKDSNQAQKNRAIFQKKYPDFEFLSWKSFHTSFFQALRFEKNLLLFLVLLIFLVVAINIYNGMKKMIFERKEEIAVFRALGSSSFSIQTVFVLNGLETGFTGSVLGLLIGLCISNHIDFIFLLIGKMQYILQYLQALLFAPDLVFSIKDNSLYSFYASIPAHTYLSEVIFITLFGMLSAVITSWAASRTILQFSITEVLRDE